MNQSEATDCRSTSAKVAVSEAATTDEVLTKAKPIISAAAAEALRRGLRAAFSRAMRALDLRVIGSLRRNSTTTARIAGPTGSHRSADTSPVIVPTTPVSIIEAPTAPNANNTIPAVTQRSFQPMMNAASTPRTPTITISRG